MPDSEVQQVEVTIAAPPAKHPGGRPPYYKTPEEMQAAIERYFSQQEGKKTVTGLALHLGFTDIHSFLGYSAKDEFAPLIARARALIQEHYEGLGQDGRAQQFSDRMLTRMGWACIEQQEHVLRPDALPSDPAAIDARIAELQAHRAQLKLLAGEVEQAGGAVCDE